MTSFYFLDNNAASIKKVLYDNKIFVENYTINGLETGYGSGTGTVPCQKSEPEP
jgi:hypothetical protein